MDPISESIVKEKLNDGNGGNAFLFLQIFERLDNIVKDTTEIKDSISPLLDEYKSRQGIKKTVTNFRISASGWVALIMAIFNLILLIKGWF